MKALHGYHGCALAAAIAFASTAARPARAEVQPFRSQQLVPFTNGITSAAYDAKLGKLTHFYEHPYRYPKAGTESRNFAYDAFPGVRVGAAGKWLDGSVAPTLVEYVPGTGIVHVRRAHGGLELDEYHYAPQGLAERVAFMLLKATRTTGSGPVDAYALYNFRLGSGVPAPGPAGEEAVYNASRDAFYEYGPAGLTFAHGSVSASSKHAATPQNPYSALLAGQDLANNAGTAGPTSDVACGFQSALGDLSVGASAWAGWFTVTALDSDVQPAVDRVRTFIAGRTPSALFADEVSAWASWQTAAPAGASTLEKSVLASSQAVLRMGQVNEPGKPNGQLVASIAPGQWNIAWVRDMAYATVALARLGHGDEAKRAVRFQLGATASQYESYVGKPYAISVVRYFGNGLEETDENADGPNIEFDGFGLFLWELEETIRATNDAALLTETLPRARTEVGDVLVALQDPVTGLIAKDSSIWEVHWNGKEEHFAYTTITAAKGLCALAKLCDRAGDAQAAATYRAAGRKAQSALMNYLRAPSGALAQSVEALARGSAFVDAAAIEAVTLGLVHPKSRTATATAQAIGAALVPPSGRGFFRNQKGGWYDSQEWIFVDLRMAQALAQMADPAAPLVLSWNVAQASENFGLFAELHDRATADYRGEVPMVGFGAGAYALALLDRGAPVEPACGEFADGPVASAVDAGSPSQDGGPTGGVSGDPDASLTKPEPRTSEPDSDGCAVNGRAGSVGGAPHRSMAAGALALSLVAALKLRRRRKTS